MQAEAIVLISSEEELEIISAVNSTTNILNLKLGGAGNLEIHADGGIKTNGTAVCNLEKIGAGTLTLSGTGNTFNGPLTITAGKVLVASTSSVNSSPTITVGSASTTALFEYQGAVGLSCNVTVRSGSTFVYKSSAAMTGQLTADPGSIVILDGALNAGTLTIPASSRLILRGNATLPADFILVNNGTLDTSTWLGTLPAGFSNNGALITREDIRTTDFAADGNGQFLIAVEGRVGHDYQLQTSATLQSGDWSDAGSPVEGSDAPILFAHTPGDSAKTVFYRVRVNP